MTRTRYQFSKGDTAPYFLTATTLNWLPLFGYPVVAQILLDSLTFLIGQDRLVVYAYVIMENHIHIVAYAQDISKEIANFKSYTARKSLDYYHSAGYSSLLNQLAREKLDHKHDRDHQFWQEGSHPQRILDREMLEQKIQYIHHNPVRRGYVDQPDDWRYSSARDYAGKTGLVPVCLEW